MKFINNIKCIFLVTVILTSVRTANGQNLRCASKNNVQDPYTIPYYGNSKFLEEIYNAIHDRNSTKSAILDYGLDPGLFHIPIKVWIFHNDEGHSQAITEEDLYTILEYANNLLSISSDLTLYLKCEIKHVNDGFYLHDIDSQEDLEDLYYDYRDPKALNIYILSGEQFEDGPYSGASIGYPSDNPKKLGLVIWVHPEFYPLLSDLAETCVHEMGHVFGLYHTFECFRCTLNDKTNEQATKCYQESVDRDRTNSILCTLTWGFTKCEINGDILCSTEAVPKPLYPPDIQYCVYQEDYTDRWDDEYIPEIENFMIYTYRGCREEFTEEQQTVIEYNILLNMYGSHPGGGFEFYYNSDILSARGSVGNSEEEEIVVSQQLTAPTTNYAFTCEDGSDVVFHVQDKIFLEPGFHAEEGSSFKTDISPITDCDEVDFYVESQTKSDEVGYELVSNSQRLQEKTSEISTIITKTLREQKKKKEMYEELLRLWEIDSTLLLNRYHGQTDLSDFLSTVKEDLSTYETDIVIYPNPVHDNLIIKKISSKVFTITIFDNLGRLILQKKFSDMHYSIDLSTISNGIYEIAP